MVQSGASHSIPGQMESSRQRPSSHPHARYARSPPAGELSTSTGAATGPASARGRGRPTHETAAAPSTPPSRSERPATQAS
eukprot:8694489-Pyramimonas_sp.AAC.1